MQIVCVCAGPNFTVDVLILGAGIFLSPDAGNIFLRGLLSFGRRFQRVLSLEGPVFVFGRDSF